MTHIPGVEFAEATKRTVRLTFGGSAICVISLDDLLTSKAASGRPQDLVDVDLLKKAKGEKPQS